MLFYLKFKYLLLKDFFKISLPTISCKDRNNDIPPLALFFPNVNETPIPPRWYLRESETRFDKFNTNLPYLVDPALWAAAVAWQRQWENSGC